MSSNSAAPGELALDAALPLRCEEPVYGLTHGVENNGIWNRALRKRTA